MKLFRMFTFWTCAVSSAALCCAQDSIDIPALPSADAIAGAPTFAADDAIVATHYFYWYRWPSEHFFDDAAHTDTGLRDHFPSPASISYTSQAWHRRQMQDMMAAGIDVALCIYWGAPNQYDKPGLSFSVRGLPPMVAALDELSQDARPPRIAMFYDTTTLLGANAYREVGRGNVDLRTEEGKDIFYRTIRDFYRLVPPRHWACLDGRPIVQLYSSGFAAGHDQSTLDYVYSHFAADFAGRRPFIIAGPSWSFRADASTGWGAALGGPILGGDFVQIGPGYDDSPVPGRTTPVRDRLGGGFYAASWMLALQRRPRMVIIETWDELHEGTGICETLEDGRLYIDLTRHYGDLFRSGRAPEADEWAATVRMLLSAGHPEPSPREWASRFDVGVRFAPGGELVQDGVWLCGGLEDGVCVTAEQGGESCIETRRGIGDHRYMYFDVADSYYYDHSGTLTLTFEYYDAGSGAIEVQYDSSQATGTIRDRYWSGGSPIVRAGTDTWKSATVVLPQARCANRQNGGADFRFASVGSELAVRSVTVTKLPDAYRP